MAKNDTQFLKDITPLVVVIGGGYLLVKSGILARVSEGVGGVAGGVGSASQGIGEGLGELGQAVGGVGTEVREVFRTTRRFIDTVGGEAGEVVTAVGDVTEDVVRGGGRLTSAALNTPFAAFNLGVAVGDKLKTTVERGRKTAAFNALNPLGVFSAAIKSQRDKIAKINAEAKAERERKSSAETAARAQLGAQKTTVESRNTSRDRLSNARKVVSKAASKAKQAVIKITTRKKRGR